MNETTTTDISKFGRREIAEAAKLLQAYSDDGAEFLGDGVTVMFNMRSGNVFLTDEDYKVGMMNGDTLEEWFTCPECGHEGFLEDMLHESEYDGCFEYMREIGVLED